MEVCGHIAHKNFLEDIFLKKITISIKESGTIIIHSKNFELFTQVHHLKVSPNNKRLKCVLWALEMAQGINTLAIKSNNLCFLPGIHIMEGEKGL